MEIESVYVFPPDHMKGFKKMATKAFSKSRGGIEAILSTTDEACLLVEYNNGPDGDVLVLTDQRAFVTKRVSISKQLTYPENEAPSDHRVSDPVCQGNREDDLAHSMRVVWREVQESLMRLDGNTRLTISHGVCDC